METNAEGVEHGDGDFIVSNTPDFSDTWVVNGSVFGNTYEKSDDNTFIDKAFGNVAASTGDKFVDDIIASSEQAKKDGGASDMDGMSERDGKADDDRYETFKDNDGNQCRRDRTTGETTIWVEGYDRVRRGKVEHVKSYWKVLHK